MDDNFKYILHKLDNIAEDITEIKVETKLTNGKVLRLDKELPILQDEVKKLQEANQIEKGKAKIINMIIGGVGAATFFIIEQALRYVKIFK